MNLGNRPLSTSYTNPTALNADDLVLILVLQSGSEMVEGRLGRRGWAAPGRLKGWEFYGRHRQIQRGGGALETKAQLWSGQFGESKGCRKNEVRVGGQAITEVTDVGLAGIQHQHHVIAQRNHWKQDDDDHDQGSKRLVPVCRCATPKAKPQGHAGNCHQGPNRI